MMSSALAASRWLAVALLLAATAVGVFNFRNIKYDFANFYDAGQKARAGEFAALYDPMAQIAGRDPFGNMSFASAPLTSYLYVPLTVLEPRPAVIAFKLAGAAAQLLALALLFRETRGLAGSDPAHRRAYLAVFAWSALLFQPLYSWLFVGGQTTPFVFLLLVSAWMALLRGRDGLAALAMAAAVVIKPAFAPAAVLVFVATSNRFRIWALAAGAGFVALSLTTLGPDVNLAFIDMVLNKAQEGNTPGQNSNPFAWVGPLLARPDGFPSGPGPAGGMLVSLGLKLGTAALILALLAGQIRAGLSRQAERHAVFAAAILLVIVLSPVVWSHYLSVLFLPFAVLIALRRHLPGWAAILFAAILVLAVPQNFLVLMRLQREIPFDTPAVVLAVTFLKSLPALLAVIGVIALRRPILSALADPAWSGVGRRDQRPPAASPLPPRRTGGRSPGTGSA